MNIKKLKQYLEENNISVSMLAKKIEMTPQGLRRAIRENTISTPNLFKLSKQLNLPISFFYEDTLPIANDSLEEYRRLTTELLQEKDKIIKMLERENEDLRSLKNGDGVNDD